MLRIGSVLKLCYHETLLDREQFKTCNIAGPKCLFVSFDYLPKQV